jgi:undecaprenyl-diphosphatase
MSATLISITQSIGYPLLFVLILAESAGVPVPGETALITAAAVAATGKLSIPVVIVVAAAAAMIGDNLGFVFARKYGRGLLQRPGRFARQRRRVLAVGEPFFARHGAKAVFFGRWITGLRTWASWLAGATNMSWRSFAVWNATGAVSWAITIGLIGFFIGQSAGTTLTLIGLIGVITLLLSGLGALLLHRRHAPSAASPPGDDVQSDVDARHHHPERLHGPERERHPHPRPADRLT